MAGRPPKPIALKTGVMTKEEVQNRKEAEERFKGNNDMVYKVRDDLPTEVSAIYQRITEELKDANILNNLDMDLLDTASYAIYRMRQAREVIDREGMLISNGKVMIKHPAVNVERDYQSIFHSCCIQLGLSPSSRTKLSMIKLEANIGTTMEDEVFG